MVDINTFLMMILYILGSILLVCLIVFVIKLISTLNRVNGILDDVDNKMAKLDKAFRIVDVVTDNIAMVSDRLVDGISGFIRKIFNKKLNGKDDGNNE